MKIFNETYIKIDLAKLIDSRLLACANSGGGKSYVLRKILEEAGSDVMSIILDYEGEFKTLREKFDYLLIGQGGDVPVDIKAAHLLPEKLLGLNCSTIIDISEFKKHERVMYVKKFLEALMDLPREYWKPCIIIVDEAHNYCGQQEKQESTHAVIDLMTRGRKRGYCGILATQRIAKLHKDASAEANNYIVGRFSQDVDMKRAAEILGFTSKTDMLSLRNLEPGQFYVFGPAISQQVEKVKVGKVQTTHPKVGMDLRGKITPPTDRIKKILSKLNDLPKEAEQKAKTIQDLQNQVRELERQARQRCIPTAKINEKQLDIAQQRGFNEAERQYKKQLQENETVMTRLAGFAHLFAQDIDKYKKEIEKYKNKEPIKFVNVPLGKVTFKSEKPIAQIINSPPCSHISNNTDAKLNLNERMILSLLVNNPQREYEKYLIGIYTGYSHSSGGFNNAMGHLNSLGLLKKGSQKIAFAAGNESQAMALLGDDVNIHDTFKVEDWAGKLAKCERSIFQFLLQNANDEFSKDILGDSTEPNYSGTSGGFNNALGHLNTLGLIVRQNGNIKLNPEVLNK